MLNQRKEMVNQRTLHDTNYDSHSLGKEGYANKNKKEFILDVDGGT